jgi:hypothetical protein
MKPFSLMDEFIFSGSGEFFGGLTEILHGLKKWL